MFVLSSRNLLLWWVRSFLTDEPQQLSMPDKSFDLLLQIIAVKCVIIMVTVKAAVPVSEPLIGVSLQVARKCQGPIVLDLHLDLVDQGNQWGEVYEPPCGGLEAPVLPPSSGPNHLLPLSCRTSSCLSLFLGFSSRASYASSTFIYLVAL